LAFKEPSPKAEDRIEGLGKKWLLCTGQSILHMQRTSVHTGNMRTRANINIDNDAYSAATAYAAARGLALGAAISELIRRADQASELPLSASPKFKRDKYGFLVVKAAGPVIPSEMAREESEDPLV